MSAYTGDVTCVRTVSAAWSSGLAMREAWSWALAQSLSCWPCSVVSTKFEAPSWPFCERHDPVTIWRGQLAGRRARIKVRP